MNELIRSKLDSYAPLLEKIPFYLLELGGKRIRPALTLMVARSFGMEKPSSDLVSVAAGIELIHMATLLHDDIIDNAPIRRHKESPLQRFGLNNTLLSGDFLLVRAFSMCAKLDRHIIDCTETACIELTEGEILELTADLKTIRLEESLEIARRKTASLFRLASESAAFLCGLRGEALHSLSQFGDNLGIAFQILDDLLDITSSSEVLGKIPGTDIRERKPASVNLLWIETQSELSEQFSTGRLKASDENIAAALSEITSGPIPQRVRELALLYTEKARESLYSGAKCYEQECGVKANLESLELLIDYTVERLQ